MKIVKLILSFIIFLFLYSFIGLIIDMIFNNSYSEVSYTVRRLIQLCLYILYVVYITKSNGIKLQYSIKPQNIFIYVIVLFAFIFLYEGTIDILIEKFITPDTMSKARESDMEQLLAYPIALFIQVCISAPLLEEVLVRGVLYEILHEKLSVISSVIICSVFFSIMHFDSFNTLFYIMVSIIFSYIYIKTGSITYCVILHMCVNAVSFFSYYLNYSLETNITKIVFMISTLIVVISIATIFKRGIKENFAVIEK